MKRAFSRRLSAIGLSFTLLLLINFASAQTIPEPPAQHPRLLMLAGEEKQIQQTIAADPAWRKMHQIILDESEAIISLPPIERIQIGRRLLDKSREALRRLFYLGYSYRLTNEIKYAQRAEKEMLAIAGFSDWNPTHYLDVGEMTMAMAIGFLTMRSGDAIDDAQDPSTSPEEAVGQAEIIVAIRAAIAERPEAERHLLQRHYFEDVNFDEAAKELGLSKSWASRLHARAIEGLAKTLRSRGIRT